jgi:superfamily II DNA or RNA helicase
MILALLCPSSSTTANKQPGDKMDSYEAFISKKADIVDFPGIAGVEVADHLFPHQRDLVRWALQKGRAAIFADTGLGKTAMQVEWARHVSDRGRVLILAPLAVAQQTVAEAKRFGVTCEYRREDKGDKITVANYEMMEKFDLSAFVGVVLDESSILKSFNGATRNAIITGFKSTPFRLAATATPAPNDFTELGNHSEFLGVKSRVEMLAEYFVHDMDTTQDWRLKGHAAKSFWRWVATWGAVVRRPSDLGYDDGAYALPPLRFHEHVIPVDHTTAHAAGLLFAVNATTLSDQRATRRATLSKRVEVATSLADTSEPVIIWCEMNDESTEIAKAIGKSAVEVTGSDDVDTKQEKLSRFASGDARVVVTKPSIAGFGLNWQHCARQVFAGASHSYEQTYQAIRRSWRFGQTRAVDIHIIRAETEQLVIDNYRRKEAEAARLGAEMAAQVLDSVRAEVQGVSAREWNAYNANQAMVCPTWLIEE